MDSAHLKTANGILEIPQYCFLNDFLSVDSGNFNKSSVFYNFRVISALSHNLLLLGVLYKADFLFEEVIASNRYTQFLRGDSAKLEIMERHMCKSAGASLASFYKKSNKIGEQFMKKTFSVLLLCILMVLPVSGVASAAEVSETGLCLSGTVIKDTGTYRLIDVSGHLVKEVSAEPVASSSNEDDGIMPCYNNTGVTRLTPMGILIYPLVRYEGKEAVLDLDSTMFYSKPYSHENYIRDTMSRAKRLEIMKTTSALGYEQIGWYMITGYNIDTYRADRFTYYEWTEAGKKGLYALAAYDGDNPFELVSYFKGGVSNTDSFKFGITGDVTYQPMATASTVTMPIELTVTLD